MSASTRSSRKRERKTYQGDGFLDDSDDFQETATVFRLPKRLAVSKSQKNPKKKVPTRDTQEAAALSSRRTLPRERNSNVPQADSNLVKLGSETSMENRDLQEIERSLCTESEKLCPSCKLIVPCDMFADHFKECMQRYKLTKEGHVKQLPIPGKEGETSGQEQQKPILPCPVCKKSFKSRTQRVIHIKMCAQDYGLTSEQLLLASRLLEKQSEEWNELGLPTSLQLHNTGPKVRNSKHERNQKDPDIAMALALSRSIAEENLESRVSREEKLLALGLEDIVEEDRKVSPMLLLPPDSVSASRMKKSGKDRKGRLQFQKSALATRSMEERERLISEKVAVMLTSEDTSRNGWHHSEAKEKSGKLTSVTSKECQLWKIARGSASEPLHSFYVHELEQYIKPKQAVIGSHLRRLSQVPGRLNVTTLQGLDEESESECEMEEATEIAEYSTQMALARLVESQEDLDISTEEDQDKATEWMESQGFIIPNLGSKTQNGSNSTFCKLGNNNVYTAEGIERNPDDLKTVHDAEGDCTTFKEKSYQKTGEDVSQSTEGSVESVLPVQPQLTEPCKLKKGSSLSENENFDIFVNSEEEVKPQQMKQHITIPVNQSECNVEATISKTLYNTVYPNSDDDPEGIEQQPENSPSYLEKAADEDISTSPTGNFYDCKVKNLAISGMEFNSKNLKSSPGRKDRSPLKPDVVPRPKTELFPVEEKTPRKNSNDDFVRDSMVHTLIKNWKGLLESGIGSDVTIKTLEGSSVQAHSLVLMVRCPKLYQESMEHANLIKWNQVPQKAVNQFLSYLYTGACEVTTPGDPLWIELYDMGLKYECKDLVSYMELLYKANNSPVKTPVLCPERDEEPLPLDEKLDRFMKISRKMHAAHLTKDSGTGECVSYSKRDVSTSVKADKLSDFEELKCTYGYDEKVLEHNENSSVNKSPQDCPKSSHRKKHRIGCVEESQRILSPDLFEDSLYVEKCMVSPVLSSPLIVIPHHSPIMETNQLEPKELEEVSNVLPKTSSPCKSAPSLGDREEKEIVLPLASTFPTTSKNEVLCESDPDITNVKGIDIESKTKSHMPIAYGKYKLNDNEDDDDDDVIDLTQSGSKCHSEECLSDHPDVINCERETEWLNCSDKVNMDVGNEKPLNCKSGNSHEHYISNVWDDFDADSLMLINEELQSSFEKPAAIIDERNSVDGPDLHPITHSQSLNHETASIDLSACGAHQKDKNSDKQNSKRSKDSKSLRCSTKCAVSPSASEETSCVEFFEGHSGDQILINAATEIEEADAVYQSRNKAESTSTVTHASLSLALTPHRKFDVGKRIVTPMPDYSKMKSPELKKELQKFGICTLGRRKAVAVLRHVYEQTHPLVTDSEAESSFSQTPQRNSGGPDLQKTQVRKNRREGSSLERRKPDNTDLMEKDVCNTTIQACEKELEECDDGLLNSSMTSISSSGDSGEVISGDAHSLDEDEEILSSTQQAGLVSQVKEIITSRMDLYRKVLLYEPIFVENLHAALKANGIKCSLQAVLDAADELCVTVRTQANQKNRGRTKSPKKRKVTSQKEITQGESI